MRTEPRADPRPRPGGTKRLLHPPQGFVHERHRRLCARSADVEINRDEFATGAKVVPVMAHNCRWVRNVKEQQSAHDRVERLGRVPRLRVTFHKGDRSSSSIPPSLTGDRDRIGGPIDSQDSAARPDELSQNPGNMAKPRAQVEHVHSVSDPRSLQQLACGTLDRSGLAIESRELFRVTAENVLLLRRLVAFHDLSSSSLRWFLSIIVELSGIADLVRRYGINPA